ncbi:MAG: DUF3071 domain-containing protein, partial [Actinobacteria bacterium]|nr:DUF3071 domain-containing protein [Actinomycetota bacterium]
MQQLHLVGVTTDHDALIFSARKGAKSGGFLVALDDRFYDTIDEAGRLRDGEENGATGRRKAAKRPSIPRVESALSPRDIQMRLRAGRSIAHVANEAGVDEDWVMRFAVPIMAEQALVVAKAQALLFSKARLGPSGRPLGESVWWNVADKGALMAEDTFDQCWTAHSLRDGVWIVRFDFINRKKRQRAEWEVDMREGTLVARNRLASELGYVEPGRRGRPPAPLPAPAKQVAPAKRAAPKAKSKAAAPRAKTTPKKARPAAKRPAKKTTKKKRATGRRAAPKRVAAKRPAAKKANTPKKATRSKATSRRPAPKRPGAKRSAPTKV